jgi:hypothetical protein
MSLILDALKKLDRDKRSKAPDGVLLLTPAPWPAARSSQTLLAVALIVSGLALLATAAFVFWNRAQSAPRDTPVSKVGATTSSPSLQTSPLPEAPPSSRIDVPIAAAPRVSAVDRRPTPLASPVSIKRTPARFRLNAIGVHKGQPVAVLNDRLVREGDRFDGITVIRIGDTDVEIEADGNRVKVTF